VEISSPATPEEKKCTLVGATSLPQGTYFETISPRERPKFIQESMKDEGLGKQGESMSFVQASGHLLRLFWL